MQWFDIEALVRYAPLHAHLSHGQQFVPGHPQVRERKQRDDLRRVLLESPVAHLHIPELLFEHSERVFHFGPDADLGALELVDQRIDGLVLVQGAAQTRAHGHMADSLRECPE